jgi:glycosyltransferase involved in cell wall biosynthesis
MKWSRGVDRDRFRPREGATLGFPRPVFLYVGRVAVEKNIEAFLTLDVPGTKVVVGDGPERRRLEAAFPQARFTGALAGEALAHAYAAADALVFPSRTDTFGNVILEALASGLPVAAYPVTGPRDIIDDWTVGALDDDLRAAALRALACSREAARAFSARFSWQESARAFRQNILVANRA